VGNIKACEPAAIPSIRALKIPPARAKNATRYTMAAIVAILDVLRETEYLDKDYFKNKSININHINQSVDYLWRNAVQPDSTQPNLISK
jgi:hypothetical protein